MPRKAIQITIDQDVWQTFNANLRSKGYPKGTASYTIQRCLEQINDDFEYFGDSQQLSLFEWKKGEKR